MAGRRAISLATLIAATLTATATASVTVLAPEPRQPAAASGPRGATDEAGRTVSTSRTLTAGTVRVIVNYN